MNYSLESAVGHTIMIFFFAFLFIGMAIGMLGIKEGLKTLLTFQKEDKDISYIFYGYIVFMLTLIWGTYAIF
jgi:hypothetical protein